MQEIPRTSVATNSHELLRINPISPVIMVMRLLHPYGIVDLPERSQWTLATPTEIIYKGLFIWSSSMKKVLIAIIILWFLALIAYYALK